jgi:hypothetical protein
MHTVRITIQSRFADLLAPVRARVWDVLVAHFTYEESRFEAGGTFGHRRRRTDRRVFGRLGRNRYWIPSFTVEPVAAELRRRGYRVLVDIDEGVWRGDRREVDWRVARAVAPGERPLVEALAGQHSGLLETAGPGQVVRAVELLCELHPRAGVLVACARTREASDLFRRLAPRLPGQVATMRQWEWHGTHRCLISSLLVPDVGHPGDWDVCVFADARQVAVPSHQMSLARLRHLRLFGFVPPGWQAGHHTRLILEGFIGPVVYRVGDGETPGPSVRVLCFRPPWSPPRGHELSPLERKRQSCWHNGPRNDAIAAVARALSAGDERTLWSHGLLLGDRPAALRQCMPPSVTVLVESPAHGRELLARLPGWRMDALVPGTPPAPGGWWVRPLDRVVLTTSAAARQPLLPADVLIRAERGEWPLSVPPFAPAAGGEILVIDLLDNADEVAARATRRRLADYAARGWTVERPPAARAIEHEG